MHTHTHMQVSRKPTSTEIRFFLLLWIKTISDHITRFLPTPSVPYTEYVLLDKNKNNFKFHFFLFHEQKQTLEKDNPNFVPRRHAIFKGKPTH